MSDAIGAPPGPLRVAYLMSRFPKATETFILNEILELERTGHRVELFPLVREREAVLQPGAAALVERAHDLRPWAIPVLRAQLHWLRRAPRRYFAAWLGAIRATIRSPRFLLRALAVVPAGAAIAGQVVALDLDHIHAHWATHPTLAAWVASRLSGRTFTFTGHAHDLYVDRTGLDAKIRAAARVVTISATNRAMIGRWYGPAAEAKVVVIHCGVDVERFAPPPDRAGAGERPIGSADRTISILCIASLQPQKGQRFLVDACRRLVDRGRDVRVVLVGEGDERRALEAQIDAVHLADRVSLTGALGRDEVVARIAAADIVVQPSVVLASGKTEGIPVALMEAMSSERPVVASWVSGIPELVLDGETGLLVPPGEAAAIADAIERLAADPVLGARLGAAGRRRVMAEFDLHDTTRRLVEVFREAIAGRL